MCGIVAFLNADSTIVAQPFIKLNQRGPEYTCIDKFNDVLFGFHRLAINGVDDKSNQPIEIDNVVLVCNGEIYNYRELYKEIKVTPVTNSDCEIIIHLYKIFGMAATAKMLDGVFAFALYDKTKNIFHVARDPFGVRPLYCAHTRDMIGFGSEMKYFTELEQKHDYTFSLRQFKPGCVASYAQTSSRRWNLLSEFFFYEFPFSQPIINTSDATRKIKNTLEHAVQKRVVGTTDRPIACLLSGGLDSSLITALVSKYYESPLETYSIGLPGGEDLKYARMVADHVGTKHTEVIVSEEDFLKAIPEVIHNIESYDTTTVRASVGNYLIGKYIKENSDAKVIFNGDGSDEVTGGYLYFNNIKDSVTFDTECKRLVTDIHMYDVQRSDKSISSNGLEPRTPFLDKEFVSTYFTLNNTLRKTDIGKYLLRRAFDDSENLLPQEVLWRTKEAFSDGVSSQDNSWFEIIKRHVKKMDLKKDETIQHLPPMNDEQRYYRQLFHKSFGKKHDRILPYFWMPRYTLETHDCSARTLKIYNTLVKK